MVLLGVILVVLAVAAGIVLFAGTAQLSDTVDIDVLGGTLSLPPLTLLVTGMVVISLFWLGWALLRGGLRRAKRRRVEAKEALAAAETRRVEEERRMTQEFAARERQLLEERDRVDAGAAGTAGTDARRPGGVAPDHGRGPAGPSGRGSGPGTSPRDPLDDRHERDRRGPEGRPG